MSSIDLNELSTIDLNLLWALHVLLEEASVSLAARRLRVGQSAVSNQLARLRALFGDPLLVRDGRGLVRTPRADGLRGPLAGLIGDMQRLVAAERGFDPARETRQFTLACDDAVEVCDVPTILAAMRRELPSASLRALSVDALSTQGGLAHAPVDAAIGPRLAFGDGAHFRPLFSVGALLAMRSDHPLAHKRMTRSVFNQLAQVDTWVGGDRPGVGHRQASAQLAEHGFQRHVTLVVSHFSAAAAAVCASDLVAGLPERVARHYARYMPLALKPLPAPLSFRLELGVAWHERSHHDPGARYFRELVVRTLTRGVTQRLS